MQEVRTSETPIGQKRLLSPDSIKLGKLPRGPHGSIHERSCFLTWAAQKCNGDSGIVNQIAGKYGDCFFAGHEMCRMGIGYGDEIGGGFDTVSQAELKFPRRNATPSIANDTA